MTARVTLTGLLAAFTLLAGFAFSTGARAQSYSIICNNGYWFVTNMYGFGYADRKIPCDEPKPGWIFDWDGPHHIRWVYDGDRVVTPYTNPGSNVVHTAVRPVQEQGNTRPLVNQPVESVFYTVPDSSNHRAVRGTDGMCYREQRVGGRWQRSNSFGSDDEACRRAAWNAYYLSQGRSLVDPAGGTFPSGSPPDRSVLESVAVDGKTLTLTFNENLDPGSLPSRWAFYVTVNGARRHVALGGVAITGQTVRLTLSSAVTHLDTVRVRYTKPSVWPLRGATGIAVATFPYRTVTNNTPVGIWSAELTAKRPELSESVGCQDATNVPCTSGLTKNTFTFAGTTYQVVQINTAPTIAGFIRLLFELDKAIPQSLTLHVGNDRFAVADATLSNGDKTAVWDRAFSSVWSVNQKVQLRVTRSPGTTGVTISVADARANEAAGASVDFEVSLSGASASAVTVDYATADGTATAGADYTVTSGTLTFAPGDTSKTVSVPVLDDTHDEGEETFTLTLSNPTGATISDNEATGTIANEDPAPKAWIARFGRTVAEQVIGAVEARMAASRTAGNEVNLGGHRIALDAPAQGAGDARDAEDAAAERRLAAWLRHADPDTGTGPGLRAGGAGDPDAGNRHALRGQGMTERELLLGSSFSLAAGDARTGSYALWGRGSVSRFDGRDGGLAVDGEVASAFLGADWSRERTTLGLILGHSIGDGGYRSESGRGTVSSTLTGLYPWVRQALGERVSLWGVAGYGEGTLTVTPANADGCRGAEGCGARGPCLGLHAAQPRISSGVGGAGRLASLRGRGHSGAAPDRGRPAGGGRVGAARLGGPRTGGVALALLVRRADADWRARPGPLAGPGAAASAAGRGRRAGRGAAAAQRPVRAQGGARQRAVADPGAVGAGIRAGRRDHGEARPPPPAGGGGGADRGPVAGDRTPAPSSEAPGPGGEHDELLKVLDALGARKSQQVIAVDVLKAADPAEDWDPNAGPRAKAKRRIKRAVALRDGGYRARFLEPRRPRRRRVRKPDTSST